MDEYDRYRFVADAIEKQFSFVYIVNNWDTDWKTNQLRFIIRDGQRILQGKYKTNIQYVKYSDNEERQMQEEVWLDVPLEE